MANLPFHEHSSTVAASEPQDAFQVQVSTASPVHKHTFYPDVEEQRPETTNRQARRAEREGDQGGGDESPSAQRGSSLS